MLYLDDVTNENWEKRGLVIWDWYFGEGMETNSASEKIKKISVKFLCVSLYITNHLVYLLNTKHWSKYTTPTLAPPLRPPDLTHALGHIKKYSVLVNCNRQCYEMTLPKEAAAAR